VGRKGDHAVRLVSGFVQIPHLDEPMSIRSLCSILRSSDGYCSCTGVHCHIPFWTTSVSLNDSSYILTPSYIYSLIWDVFWAYLETSMSEPLARRKTRRPRSRPLFHLFPRLPLELRIQIWQEAVFERLLIINGNRTYDYWYGENDYGCWSPTSAPAATRVCRESRKYNSYRKLFLEHHEHHGQYIWVNPEYDIFQLKSIPPTFFEQMKDVTQIRFDVSEFKGQHLEELLWPPEGTLTPFLGAKNVDVLVADEVAHHACFVDDWPRWWSSMTTHFPRSGARPRLRIVSCRTGEWMDTANCGVFWDWLDYQDYEGYVFTRRVDEGVEGNEERARKVDEFQGLPRTGLDYW
jgi:hypothetical protein